MPASVPRKAVPRAPKQSRRVRDLLLMAEEQGLLQGARDQVVRGRMPSALVEEARRSTGIQSDSRLLEAALASLVVQDDYAAWLVAHRGTVDPDIDLEF